MRLGVPGAPWPACPVAGVPRRQRARRHLDLCSSAGWSAILHQTFEVLCSSAA